MKNKAFDLIKNPELLRYIFVFSLFVISFYLLKYEINNADGNKTYNQEKHQEIPIVSKTNGAMGDGDTDSFIFAVDLPTFMAPTDYTFRIPTYAGEVYDYMIDIDNDGIFDIFNVTGDYTIDFGAPGMYFIRIQGDFPGINIGQYHSSFDPDYTRYKMAYIYQWGAIDWKRFDRSFAGSIYLGIVAEDAPNLSNLTSLEGMFMSINMIAVFDGWDLSNVTNISYMFNSVQNIYADLTYFDVSNVTNMRGTFGATNFNQNIGGWNVSNVQDMSDMFSSNSVFNQDIGGWSVSNVTTMEKMFSSATSFNQDIGDWDVSNVTTMRAMFEGATMFNQDIGDWDVGNVTLMDQMFRYATAFNQDLNSWDTSNVERAVGMFDNAVNFNGEIGNWDTSKMQYLNSMFEGAISFNQDIGGWNLSGVINSGLNSMFKDAINFNQNIGSWNVSSVREINSMFEGATSFNQDISAWDLTGIHQSGYYGLNRMFAGAINFDQDLSAWNVANVPSMVEMFEGVKLSTQNYDAMLSSWSTQSLQQNVIFGAGNSEYCAADERDILVNAPNSWVITDAGIDSSCGGTTPISIPSDLQIISPSNAEVDGTNATEITFKYTINQEYSSGDSINIIFDIPIISTISNCLSQTNDIDGDGNTDGGFTSFTETSATYTVNSATTDGIDSDITMCLTLPAGIPMASYTLRMNDSIGNFSGAFLYVNYSNSVFITAEVGLEMSFNIRNREDTADTNICNIGLTSLTTNPTLPIDRNAPISTSVCAYGLAIGTSTVGGLSVTISSNSGLTNGSYTFTDITNGDNFVAGTETYGIVGIHQAMTGYDGAANHNEPLTLVNQLGFSFNTNNQFGYATPIPTTPLIFMTHPRQVSYIEGVDNNDLTVIYHGANAGPNTESGTYSQAVTYLVTPVL